MDKQTIIAALKSKPGYSFREGAIDEALARGLQDGDILMGNGQITVRVEGTNAIARDPKGAQVGPAMDLTDPANADRCLQMYAMRVAQLPIKAGA